MLAPRPIKREKASLPVNVRRSKTSYTRGLLGYHGSSKCDRCGYYYRFQQLHLTAESEPCECEVADNGVGLEGSVKRVRAYNRKVI